MTFWRKLFGLPEEEDGTFAIAIPKKEMIQHGWDIKGGKVYVEVTNDKIVITKPEQLNKKPEE